MEAFFKFKMDVNKDYPWYYRNGSFNDMVIEDWFEFHTNLQRMCLSMKYITVDEHRERIYILTNAGQELNMSKDYYISDEMTREQLYELCYDFMTDFWDTITKKKTEKSGGEE